MNIKRIENFLKERGEPKYRIEQIKKAIYKDSILEFNKITTLSKDLGNELNENFKILSVEEEKKLKSSVGNSFNNSTRQRGETLKALLRLNDGNLIETVLLKNEAGWTACVSTQSGCALGCKFCATGRMGFKRNLADEEITDQILYWRAFLNDENKNLRQYAKQEYCRSSLTNIVYMGMGEPFLNWENTEKSLKNLTDKNLFGYGARSISVSTVGIPEGIINFAKIFPQMNLAISLHLANDKKRSSIMPINKKYNLFDLKKAIVEYFKLTNRKIFIEWVMLSNINDSISDARELIDYIKCFKKKNLMHINLISYNETGREFKPSSIEKIKQFEEYLLENKIHTTIRRSLGKDIKGACGQLGSV